MQPGDEISCCDEYGNWYRSTILDIKNEDGIFDVESEPVQVAKVAFRYLDPEGQKEDDLGRKVTGWTSVKFD